MKKFLLGAASLAALLPSMVAAQAYTPSSNDTVYVSDRTNTRHTVNAYTYIQAAAGAGGSFLATNNSFTGTNSFANTFTVSPASHNVTISPTGTGTVTISPAGALTINPTTASALDNTVIGGGTPLAGTFTTETAANDNATTAYKLNGVLLASVTAPTITTGFGTSPSIPHANGTAAFTINVGTSNTGTGELTLPTAPNGWACNFVDSTTVSATVFKTQSVPTDATHVTLQNYSDAAATHAWVDSDILTGTCLPY